MNKFGFWDLFVFIGITFFATTPNTVRCCALRDQTCIYNVALEERQVFVSMIIWLLELC